MVDLIVLIPYWQREDRFFLMWFRNNPGLEARILRQSMVLWPQFSHLRSGSIRHTDIGYREGRGGLCPRELNT